MTDYVSFVNNPTFIGGGGIVWALQSDPTDPEAFPEPTDPQDPAGPKNDEVPDDEAEETP